jgi:predicted O-methyltransferase YrrM
MPSKLRDRIATSRIARGAAFPMRAAMVARYDARLIARSVDWLMRSRETTNMTYDLDALNRDQLCWFVAAVSGTTVGQVRAWIQELEDDEQLFDHLTERFSTNPRRGIGAKEPRWGRRLGWYAFVRALQPEHVVETGTQLGLGSCAIAAALLRNGHGRLTTVDIEPNAGYLVGEPWANVIDLHIGSSTEVLADVKDVDIFIHDSLHTYEYETQELAAVEPNLRAGALALSDNAHASAALSDWAERTGRAYLFFKEQPIGHWWPGDGIGAAWSRSSSDK